MNDVTAPYDLHLRNMITESKTLKTSKAEMNKNAIRFKTNIEQAIIDGDAAQKGGARYECIYKNLLREIRQFYSTKFN
jgi:hypothetical protein